MASIPLPALGIRPPAPAESPLDTYARALQIKGMQQGQQLQGQTLQMNDMQLKSQQALMKAYTDAGGDLDKALPLAARYGAMPSDLIKLRQAALQVQQQNLALFQAKGQKAVQDSNLMFAAHKAVDDAPPEQKPAIYQQQLQQLQNAGVDVSQAPPDYPGDQAFKMWGVGITAHKQQMEDLAAKAGLEQTQAKTAAEQSQKKLTDLQANAIQQMGGLNPQQQEARYRFTLQKIAAKQPVSPDDMAAAVAYEASQAKTNTTADSMGVMTRNTSRPSGLAALGAGRRSGPVQGAGGPSTQDSLIDLIGQYKADPSLLGRMLYRHPEVLGLLHQKYPDFDETNYVSKNKLMQSYTSGQKSGEINAISTVAGHLGELDTAANALNNGDVQALNRLANAYKLQVGATPQATFRTIVNRIGPEITKAYISGGGGEAERFANAQDFSANLSPQQLHGNIAETVKLLRSKIGALENQYKQTVGRDDFAQRFITPQAQQAFTRLAGDSATAPGKYKVGETRNYQGANYTFNGTQWVRQ